MIPKGERFLRFFYSNFTKVRFLILHGMLKIRHVKTN